MMSSSVSAHFLASIAISDGFKNFSNPRAYKDVGFKFDKLFEGIRPPYTKSIENLIKGLLK